MGRAGRRGAGGGLGPWRSVTGTVSPWLAPAPAVREAWALRTAATLRPGQKGTRHLVAEFGERPVSVRYREDPRGRKRYKTAEIIVAEMDWAPPPGPDDPVRVRVAWEEEDLRARVKQAGGRWRPQTKTWELPFRAVVALGLEDRVVTGPGT